MRLVKNFSTALENLFSDSSVTASKAATVSPIVKPTNSKPQRTEKPKNLPMRANRKNNTGPGIEIRIPANPGLIRLDTQSQIVKNGVIEMKPGKRPTSIEMKF